MKSLADLDILSCDRLIIKIGSALLVHPETGKINSAWLHSLAEDIAFLQKNNVDVLIVSSGSIALGKQDLGLTSRPTKLEEAQAAAAIGQGRLAQAYAEIFQHYALTTAQILLSAHDLEDRRRYLNARGTLETLLSHHIIPVINENDTVATSEIRFGDNDRLAAHIGGLAKADLVILLSDIDGLYTANPKQDRAAEFIPIVPTITADIEKMASPAESKESSVGTGGMVTKIMAAKQATQAGSSLAIVQGQAKNPIKKMLETKRGTLFPAKEKPLDLRKRWLSSLMHPAGIIQIDQGAEKALRGGASLLPVGVTSINGTFDRGDLVTIMSHDHKTLGQGLINFCQLDAEKIIGCTRDQIRTILDYCGRSHLIHRDDLVLFL